MARARPSQYTLLKTKEPLLRVIQHKETGLLLGYLRRPRPGVTTWRAYHSNEYTDRARTSSWMANESTAEAACSCLHVELLQKRLDDDSARWLPDHSHYILQLVEASDDPVDLDQAAMLCPPDAYELLRKLARPSDRVDALVRGTLSVLTEWGCQMESTRAVARVQLPFPSRTLPGFGQRVEGLRAKRSAEVAAGLHRL